TFTANVAVITKNGQSSNLDYRQSNVWVRHNGRWIIVHENASPPVQISAKNIKARSHRENKNQESIHVSK
ncbi:nuclear transport factor 2 family protein, partial [Chroococcidiopsis sp.]|uniref:nuclear transport factor 2 family protein n=1 Tax=Chroococcidiopsis sp. TaxID=3088168 RepID=UPI003F2E91AE